MNHPTRLIRGLIALSALATLTVGVPAALWHFVGWPLPHAVPTWAELRTGLSTQMSDDVLIKSLAVLTWASWTAVVLSIAAEMVAVAGRRAPVRLPGLAPLQRVAGHLVAAVVLAANPVAPRPAGHPLRPPLSVAAVQRPSPPGLARAPHVPTRPGATRPARPLRPPPSPTTAAHESNHIPESVHAAHVVRHRETLWGIAEQHLGDPQRWREIFALNEGRPQLDGHALTDPRRILPGWILRLPTPSTSPTDGEARLAAAGPNPAKAILLPAAQPATAPAPPVLAPSTPTAAPVAPIAGPANSLTPSTSTPTTAAAPAREEIASPDHRAKPGPSHTDGVELPDGSTVAAALAIGLVAALGMARLRRRARYIPGRPAPGFRHDDPLVTPAVAALDRAAHQAPDDESTEVSDRSVEGDNVTNGGIVPIGRDAAGGEVTINFLAAPIAVDGAGALDVLRAVLLTVLAPSRPDQAAVLVGDDDVTGRLLTRIDVPGIETCPDAVAVLHLLEVEIVARTRLLADCEADDFGAFARDCPDYPLPLLVVAMTDPPTRYRPLFDAIAGPAGRLGIAILVAGDSGLERRVTVDAHGAVSQTTLAELDRAHLYHLTRDAGADTLAVLAVARQSEGPPAQDAVAEAPFAAPAEAAVTAPLINLQLLGPERLLVAGVEVLTGVRAKARELLAFLAVHPGGVTWEVIVDAVWPDAEPKRGWEGFRTCLANIRALRGPGNEATVVERRRERYRLNSDVVACDLWQFQRALRIGDAEHADETIVAALSAIADLYRGDFCAATYYPWVEPVREDLRQRAIDALSRLAEARLNLGDANASADVYEHLLRVDPYCEHAARRLIDLCGQLRRPDLARRTYQRLKRHLDELDVDPDPATRNALATATGGHPHLRPVAKSSPPEGSGE